MKLYYDMLIPFMPDSKVDENGNVVPDIQKIEGRKAMSELAEFQSSGNVLCLYNSVYHACLYADVDLYDKLLNLPEDIEIPAVSIADAVRICVDMLFRTSNPNSDEKFDIDRFICLLLTSAHFALETLSNRDKKTENPEHS